MNTLRQTIAAFIFLAITGFPATISAEPVVLPQAASRAVGTDVYYYAALGEAFAAAAGASLDEPDEIILLADIVISEPILIDTAKHIRLVAGNAGDGGSSRTIKRDGSNTANPLFRVTGEGASLTLGKPGMEYELFIDGGYLNTPPVRSEAPLIAVNGPDSKVIMYDKVTLQNNYNMCAAPGTDLYRNGAGVFIRTLEDRQQQQAEFIMKGGTIRGNINNTQNAIPCGGGVFIAGFGLFTMEGGVIAGNTAYRTGGGFHTGSRGSFRKTGGIIYGYDAPVELQNKVIRGVGRPPVYVYGYAVCVPPAPPAALYRGRDATATETVNLTFTGAQVGEIVFFGANEAWETFNPSGGPSFPLMIVLAAVSVLLASALVLVLLLLRKRKAAGEPAEAAPAPVETEKPEPEEHPDLSPREKEIFALLLTESSLKEIAHILNVTYSAVNFHTKNIYRKLGIQSRVELFTKFGKK
jgi:DNA-binding CsgD family transcriptional regulator